MVLSSGKIKTALLGGVAALTVAGAVVTTSAPAEAGWRGYRGGGYYGGYRGFYGGHRGFYGYRHYNRGFGGGALAAGLIGGVALGAIAANSYPYGYGYGYGGYYPATYAQPVYYGGYGGYGGGYGGCWIERRVRFTPWGERVVRKVQICG